ncbi:hypothetical protein [Cerasicoccus fimbriatus]|uniref:hypothetical protein n=1 Tax=Cerasicoccus fimbriatus TaxID=3014554 RepID=UPI0022B4F68D|nr:hypothetical protein [Cerasicoccus sp. TK19100]
MKFIPHSEVSLDHSIRVTADQTPRQILRIDLDTYVIVDMERARMVTAFESEKLSELINTLRCAIIDIEVIATRYIHTSRTIAPQTTGFEIRLHLENGQSIIFTSEEESFTLQGQSAKSLLEESRKPATEALSLPNQRPFNRILVTDEFAKWISTLTLSGNCQQVIEAFWRDFKCHAKNRELLKPGKPILIIGEFGQFYAAEYLCGRVSFHCAT